MFTLKADSPKSSSEFSKSLLLLLIFRLLSFLTFFLRLKKYFCVELSFSFGLGSISFPVDFSSSYLEPLLDGICNLAQLLEWLETGLLAIWIFAVDFDLLSFREFDLLPSGLMWSLYNYLLMKEVKKLTQAKVRKLRSILVYFYFNTNFQKIIKI